MGQKLLVSITFLVSFLFLSGCSRQKAINTTIGAIANKNEQGALEVAKNYWEATKFKDWSARYSYVCQDIKDLVTKEKYIAKYKEDNDERPLARIDKYELGDVRLEGDKAFIRVTLFGLADSENGQSDMTELSYENKDWCKVISEETKEWLVN